MTKEAYEQYLAELKGYKFDGTPESHQKGLELYEKVKQTSRRSYWRGNDFRRFKRQKRFGYPIEKKLHRLAELVNYDLVNNKINFTKPKVGKPVAKVEKKKEKPEESKAAQNKEKAEQRKIGEGGNLLRQKKKLQRQLGNMIPPEILDLVDRTPDHRKLRDIIDAKYNTKPQKAKRAELVTKIEELEAEIKPILRK